MGEYNILLEERPTPPVLIKLMDAALNRTQELFEQYSKNPNEGFYTYIIKQLNYSSEINYELETLLEILS